MKELALFASLALSLSLAHAAPLDDLIKAAELNNTSGTTKLLAQGVGPNQRDARGFTPLTMAVREDSARVVKVLLADPAVQVDVPNGHDETALMLAAIKGNLPLAKTLAEKGAAINRRGWTPLHYACSGPDQGVTAWLLRQGAELNARSPNGSTPLMMAARYGLEKLAAVLLEAGADVHAVNEQNLSAQDFAERAGRKDLAQRLKTWGEQHPKVQR